MIKKLLIANRGEIACRIIRTAHRMGIETVAVYSEPDENSLHVRSANQAILIGPASLIKSYLSIEAILRAAKSLGVDSIHPGYGFLSENADFADAVRSVGLVFVGPSGKAIRDMGGMQAIVMAMTTHPDCEGLQMKACRKNPPATQPDCHTWDSSAKTCD